MTYEEEVANPRREIDRLSEEILAKIAERVHVAMRIGEIKRKYGKPIYDQTREQVVLTSVRIRAAELGLDPEAAARVFEQIVRLTTVAEGRQRSG